GRSARAHAAAGAETEAVMGRRVGRPEGRRASSPATRRWTCNCHPAHKPEARAKDVAGAPEEAHKPEARAKGGPSFARASGLGAAPSLALQAGVRRFLAKVICGFMPTKKKAKAAEAAALQRAGESPRFGYCFGPPATPATSHTCTVRSQL